MIVQHTVKAMTGSTPSRPPNMPGGMTRNTKNTPPRPYIHLTVETGSNEPSETARTLAASSRSRLSTRLPWNSAARGRLAAAGRSPRLLSGRRRRGGSGAAAGTPGAPRPGMPGRQWVRPRGRQSREAPPDRLSRVYCLPRFLDLDRLTRYRCPVPVQ